MKDYLQHYQMKLTALSPIHVGSGKSIGKKEYIQNGFRNSVIIPDQEKMIQDLVHLHKERAYEIFMLSGTKSLGEWLLDQRIDKARIQKWKRYELSAGDAFIKADGAKGPPKDINCFCMDPYGMPYIPGTTLKGMMRTALLAHEIRQNPTEFTKLLHDLEISAAQRRKPTVYLSRETKNIECQAFHTLHRPGTKAADAVNSVMSGLIVSDSRPIPVSRLTLCQKIDYSLNRNERAIPTLREAIMPGTEVLFDVTIDTEILPYSMEDILTALNEFQSDCFSFFYKRFGRGSNEDGIVWIGGGTGFLSKTILYNAFDSRAVRTTDRVFRATLGGKYREHKHEQDIRLNLAPHVCKCTRYGGKLYDMGMGKLEVLS